MNDDLKQVQKAVASLLPEVRSNRGDYLPSMQESLPIATELYLIAFAMKAAHRPAGLKIAGDYSRIVGLKDEEIYQFTLNMIRERAADFDDQV